MHKNETQDVEKECDDTSAVTCCTKEEVSSMQKKGGPQKQKFISAILVLLAGVLAVNTVVMGMFGSTVDKKLGEALERTKPQEGALTLVLPAGCSVCGDLSVLKQKIKSQNIEIIDDTIFSSDSTEGQKFIQEMGIEKLPAMVFSARGSVKDTIIKSIEQGSRKIGDNMLVWEQGKPPYMDTSSGEVSGLVHVTYIRDKSCTDCYDVQKIQRPILQQFGVAVVAENSVDISEEAGKELLAAYNITAVPTILLSPETIYYGALASVWGQVGTVESDGSFIFRDPARLGVAYKDLETGKVVSTPSS